MRKCLKDVWKRWRRRLNQFFCQRRKGPLSYFSLRGSVIPLSLLISCLSGFLCFALMYWNVVSVPTAGGGLMQNPNIFGFFLQISALILAFHANSSYNRYWEARTATQTMQSGWARAASSITQTEVKPEVKADVLHLISTLHACAIQYLLSTDGKEVDLEILGGLSREEAFMLSNATTSAPYTVFSWIVKLVNSAASGCSSISINICTNHLNVGFLAYDQACKIEDTPFPFPYLQVLYVVDFIVVIIVPFVVACWMDNIAFAVVLNVMLVFTFQSLFSTSHTMESPFGLGPNDLPLLAIHEDLLNRLRCLLDGPVSRCLNTMLSKNQHTARMRFFSWTVQQDDSSGGSRDESEEKEAQEEGMAKQSTLFHPARLRRRSRRLWKSNSLELSKTGGISSRRVSPTMLQTGARAELPIAKYRRLSPHDRQTSLWPESGNAQSLELQLGQSNEELKVSINRSKSSPATGLSTIGGPVVDDAEMITDAVDDVMDVNALFGPQILTFF